MKKQINTAPTTRLLIGNIAVVLLATAGISAAMAWAQGAADGTGAAPVPSTPQSLSEVEVRASVRCAECGVVESIRLIEQFQQRDDGGPAGTVAKVSRSEGLARAARMIQIAEITLRMSDGASHRFTDANPANWRLGERVIFIEGMRTAK